MNVKLRFETHLIAGCHWRNRLLMNNYDVTIHMVTQTVSTDEQNVAFDRMRAMVDNFLNSRVFIDSSEQKQCKLYRSAGVEISNLPEAPLDQIIGIMLFLKLNAVMEGRIVITSLDLGSELGDRVVYTHADGEAIGPFESSGWWHDPTPVVCDQKYRASRKEDSIVELNAATSWSALNLDWEPNEKSESDGTVVYADFKRDDN